MSAAVRRGAERRDCPKPTWLAGVWFGCRGAAHGGRPGSAGAGRRVEAAGLQQVAKACADLHEKGRVACSAGGPGADDWSPPPAPLPSPAPGRGRRFPSPRIICSGCPALISMTKRVFTWPSTGGRAFVPGRMTAQLLPPPRARPEWPLGALQRLSAPGPGGGARGPGAAVADAGAVLEGFPEVVAAPGRALVRSSVCAGSKGPGGHGRAPPPRSRATGRCGARRRRATPRTQVDLGMVPRQPRPCSRGGALAATPRVGGLQQGLGAPFVPSGMGAAAGIPDAHAGQRGQARKARGSLSPARTLGPGRGRRTWELRPCTWQTMRRGRKGVGGAFRPGLSPGLTLPGRAPPGEVSGTCRPVPGAARQSRGPWGRGRAGASAPRPKALKGSRPETWRSPCAPHGGSPPDGAARGRGPGALREAKLSSTLPFPGLPTSPFL